MEVYLKRFLTEKAAANLAALQAQKSQTVSEDTLVCNRVLRVRDVAELQGLNPLLVVCPFALVCNWQDFEPCYYEQEARSQDDHSALDWPRIA